MSVLLLSMWSIFLYRVDVQLALSSLGGTALEICGDLACEFRIFLYVVILEQNSSHYNCKFISLFIFISFDFMQFTALLLHVYTFRAVTCLGELSLLSSCNFSFFLINFCCSEICLFPILLLLL